jgi:hypothetical protein
MTGETSGPCANYGAFWLKLISIFSLLLLTAFIKSSRLLAMPPTLAPRRLMLAVPSSPLGSDGSLATVGTLSEGFQQVVTFLLYLLGYC